MDGYNLQTHYSEIQRGANQEHHSLFNLENDCSEIITGGKGVPDITFEEFSMIFAGNTDSLGLLMNGR